VDAASQLNLPMALSDPPLDAVRLAGRSAEAISPEGLTAKMLIADWLALVRPPRVDTGSLTLPPGVRQVFSDPPLMVMVLEVPPGVHNLQWIAGDSPAPYGPEATYRAVRLGLPYLVIFALFAQSELGLQLTKRNELFFRTQPVRSVHDELCFPALLNCSRYEQVETPGKSLSWLCTQHMDRDPLLRIKDENLRIHASLDALRSHLLEGTFNYSSEHWEHSSWYTEYVKRQIDRRLSPIERWVEATAADPLFVFEVPWIPTGYSVRRLADRMLREYAPPRPPMRTSSDLARVIFNGSQTRKKQVYPHALW
jgi:hypothetical protein